MVGKGFKMVAQLVSCFHFGKARQGSSSHRIYKTPWKGDPRVNIQNKEGKAKAYQVKQVLRAIKRITFANVDCASIRSCFFRFTCRDNKI